MNFLEDDQVIKALINGMSWLLMYFPFSIHSLNTVLESAQVRSPNCA
jgi:hypothetical protein